MITSPRGATIRTRATWYEQGEKSSKYFLNSENSRGKKSSIRKLFKDDESLTSDPQAIMKELRPFYSDLYQNRSSENSNILTDSLLSEWPEQMKAIWRKPEIHPSI